MTDAFTIRERFAVDDRTFMVLGQPCYDRERDEWKGRFIYLPLDRSFAEGAVSAPVKSARRRDEVIRLLGGASDRDIARALRELLHPAPGASRPG